MPSKAKKRSWYSRGLTLPGYKYLGPFNSLDNGEPTNASDQAARKHDAMYKQLSDKHGFFAPYFKFSKADQDFINEAKDDDYGGRWGRRFFEFKKRYASSFAPERQQVVSAQGGSVLGKRARDDDPLPFFSERRQETSLLNLQDNTQQDANMDGGNSSALGSGNNLGLKETPVDPVGQVTRGPPEFAFASLPYVRDTQFSVTANTYDVAFRMTSPYDPSITLAAASDLNAGAGTANAYLPEASDVSDVTVTSARWYDFYSTLYNYYHVVGAKWHATIENLSNDHLWCHQVYFNDEVPPAGATNEDIMCWSDARSHLVGCHAAAIYTDGTLYALDRVNNVNNVEGGGTAGVTPNYATGNHIAKRGVSPILTLAGKYSPGQFKRQIHLDSEVENWTGIAANPTLPEKLLLRFKPVWNGLDTNDANSYQRLIKFRINFRIDYLVEFKELKFGLRWPVERQPVIAAVNVNLEEDEE